MTDANELVGGVSIEVVEPSFRKQPYVTVHVCGTNTTLFLTGEEADRLGDAIKRAAGCLLPKAKP